MTPQQIVGLVVRIFAIWLVVSAVQLIGIGVALDRQVGLEKTDAPYIISAVMILCAFALWLFPMSVAHKLVPRTKFINTIDLAAQEAAVVACITLGLWVFVARALPPLVQYVSAAMAFPSGDQSIIYEMGVKNNILMVEGLVELVASTFLIFNARGISVYLLTLPNGQKGE